MLISTGFLNEEEKTITCPLHFSVFINSSPEMFAEFYGANFPTEFKNMYQRFSEYKFDRLRPYFSIFINF